MHGHLCPGQALFSSLMYQLAVYTHLLAAIVWMGGTLFLFLVLVPVARGIQDPPGAGVRVLSAAARRFRVVAWVSLLVLVGTGIWILLERGVSPAEIVTGQGRFIQALRIKVILVALVVVLSALHDFLIGPELARRLETLRGPSANIPSLVKLRTLVSWLARVNLLLVLAITALGVVLVRGTPF